MKIKTHGLSGLKIVKVLILTALFACCGLATVPAAMAGDNDYLCAQLNRIRAEENMPAISAGLIVPEPLYPQNAPLPFRLILCANGVREWGGSQQVNDSAEFNLGSISKPVTGLMIARLIAIESQKTNPRLTWNTRLEDFFDTRNLPGSNRCYDRRTVSDLMAHTAGFQHVPLGEPPDQWMSQEADVFKRRQMFVEASLKDPPGVTCTNPNGNLIFPELPEYYSGGSIIATHMAEIITGQSWEELLFTPLPLTNKPGLHLNDFSVELQYATGHVYNINGIPSPSGGPVQKMTNAPAGGVSLTVSQMAYFLTQFMDGSRNLSGRLLPDSERAGLLTQHGKSSFNRLGWQVRLLDSNAFASVARWKPSTLALWHNGLVKDCLFSEAYVVPQENAAIFVMGTADGPYSPPKSDGTDELLIQNRVRATNKTLAELTALRLHYGDASEIVFKQSAAPPTATLTTFGPALGRAESQYASLVNPLVDGRLTTKMSLTAQQIPVTITLTYDTPRALDRIVVVEDEGERISRYELDYQDEQGQWHNVATNTAGQDLIFPHRIFTVEAPSSGGVTGLTHPPAYAKKIRFKILAASQPPRLIEIASALLEDRPYRPLWWRRGLMKALDSPIDARIKARINPPTAIPPDSLMPGKAIRTRPQ